jgi:hypothetical protein
MLPCSAVSLLHEIQEAAIDANTSLAVVLRKCMVLAARLGHEPFKKWVDQELGGYPQAVDLPMYRRISGIASIGHFAGPLGAAMNNVPLRLAPIPADMRGRYETAEFREGIAKLEDMSRRDEGQLLERWSGDLVALVSRKFFEDYVLLAAHKEIPRHAVVGVLDAVRNRVLKFALEIEAQSPEAGDVNPGSDPAVAPERVGNIFNTYIMGGAQNVAVGSPSAVQHAQQLQVGDVAGLKRFLAEQGVQPDDVAELESAIATDSKPVVGEPFGARVGGWIGKMTAKAATGVWKIGTSTAAEVLTAAIKSHYGLP